jgi:nicotinamide mononucleotide transporter
MMARRLLENWFLWIAVDILGVGLFWVKDLKPTAALYGVFLIMCLFGYASWRRAEKRGA